MTTTWLHRAADKHDVTIDTIEIESAADGTPEYRIVPENQSAVVLNVGDVHYTEMDEYANALFETLETTQPESTTSDYRHDTDD